MIGVKELLYTHSSKTEKKSFLKKKFITEEMCKK